MTDKRSVLAETTIAAKPEKLKQVRMLVLKAASEVGFPPERRYRLALAIDEACTNIIKHAYQFATDREISLVIEKSSTALIFRLSDDAEKADPSVLEPVLSKELTPGGLGLHFIHEIIDDVSFVDTGQQGNTLELVTYF